MPDQYQHRNQGHGADQVLIDIALDAPIEKCWQAWTDPDTVIRWFGSDPQGKGLSASIDLRNGGAYEISFQDSSGLTHTCFGNYIDLQPLNYLQFTWTWKSEPDTRSLVTIQLQSSSETTTIMHFQHANLGYTSAHQYQQGWTHTFEKLSRLLQQNLH